MYSIVTLTYVSGEAQMTILQDLPGSLCEAGPENVDGIGNYHLQIMSSKTPQEPVATLYFLDSHGEVKPTVRTPDYDAIKPSQVK